MKVERINTINALLEQCIAISDLLMTAESSVDMKSVNCAGEMLVSMLTDVEKEANDAFEEDKNSTDIEEKSFRNKWYGFGDEIHECNADSVILLYDDEVYEIGSISYGMATGARAWAYIPH